MKMQHVVYKENGAIHIVTPSKRALEKYGIMAIALKDVPAGVPFKIFDEDNMPWNWPIETWDIEDQYLTDGVGSTSNAFEVN